MSKKVEIYQSPKGLFKLTVNAPLKKFLEESKPVVDHENEILVKWKVKELKAQTK